MQSTSIASLEAFDQQLAVLLQQSLRPGYDIMQYNDYFNEKPPPIKTQNKFVDSNRTSNLNRLNHSTFQSGIKRTTNDQFQGFDENVKHSTNYLKPNQSNLNPKNEAERNSRTYPMSNPLNDFIKPSYNNMDVQNTMQSQKDNQPLDLNTINNKFSNHELNAGNSQAKVEAFNSNVLGTKSQKNENSTFGKYNPQVIGSNVDLNQNEEKINYLQKFSTMPDRNQQIYLNDLSEHSLSNNQNNYSKSPNKDPSRLYNNYMSNLTNKYGGAPVDVNTNQNISNGIFKSHVMNKKVSSR